MGQRVHPAGCGHRDRQQVVGPAPRWPSRRPLRCALPQYRARTRHRDPGGLHTAEVERQGRAVTGLAVRVGARVAALAHASEALVTSTVQMLVSGSGIGFADRAGHSLKGVPERCHLFAVKHT
jgi:class 3 adenylate cyclase